MSDAFNPYHKWLGIPPEEQPPHHYRLLGVAQLESDPDVIAMAADQRMAFLRSFQNSEQSELSQQLLNEVAAAKLCLLNAKEKARYDAELARKTPPDAPPPLPAGDDSQSEFAAFAVGSQLAAQQSQKAGAGVRRKQPASGGPAKKVRSSDRGSDRPTLKSAKRTQPHATRTRRKKNALPLQIILGVVAVILIGAVFLLLSKLEQESPAKRTPRPVAAVEQPPPMNTQTETLVGPAPVRASSRGSKPKRNGAGRTNSRHALDAEYESHAQAIAPDATSAPKVREKPEPAAQEQQRLAQRAERKAAKEEAQETARRKAAEEEEAERERKADAAKIAEAEHTAKEKTEQEIPAIQDNPESLLESKGLVKKGSKWILAIEGPLQKRAQTLQTQWKQFNGLRRQFVGVDKKIATDYLLKYHELLEQTRSYHVMRAAVAEDYGKILEDEQIMAALEKLGQNTKSLPRTIKQTIKQYEKPDKKLRQVFPKGPPQLGNFVLLIINETTPVVIEQDTTKLQHKEAKTLLILPRADWEAAGLPDGTPTQKRMHDQWQPKLWAVAVPSLRWGTAIAKNAKAYRMDSHPKNQDKAYGGRVGPVGWQTFLQQLRPAPPMPKPTAEQIAEARTKLAKAGRQAAVAEKKIAKTERKERQAKAKKENAEAEQKAEKKEPLKQAKREAEAALAALKLEPRKGGKGEPIWYLQNDEADQYKKLRKDRSAKQIEPLEESRNVLLEQYNVLADNSEVKKHLKLLGGELATENDLHFWPDEVRADLSKKLQNHGDVWILTAELNFLESVEQLESQRDEIIELRKKGSDKTKAKEKAKEFGKELETTKALYASLGEKYEELNSDTELIAKIESLGNRLGPTLTDKAWTKQQKRFANVVKTPSRTKSGVRMPRPIFSSNTILQLDGTDATQNAFMGKIAQPPTITAEAVVRVKQGRKYGAIVGQALDNDQTEQGWNLGYDENNFTFQIASVGGGFPPHAESKTRVSQDQKVHHVVGTYDGRMMKLYVDGVVESTKPMRGPINYPKVASSPFTIGAFKDSNEYLELNGTIFLVRVYNGPLTDAQVANRYNEVKEKIDKLNNAP